METEMPKYQAHKKVWALKISAIEIEKDGSATLAFKDDRFASINLDKEWTSRFKGSENDDAGYYVVYKDGYKSWSPTKAFEEGYSEVL